WSLQPLRARYSFFAGSGGWRPAPLPLRSFRAGRGAASEGADPRAYRLFPDQAGRPQASRGYLGAPANLPDAPARALPSAGTGTLFQEHGTGSQGCARNRTLALN